MQQSNKLDFRGQRIYVALDTHKKTWKVTILTDVIEHKTYTQQPDIGILVNYLHSYFPGGDYLVVYEAGFCGFWIHDRLKEKGINCIVVNPADVPTTDKERKTKSDRVDSRKLAKSLRNGDLKGIYIPSRQRAEDRSLVRTRQSMVKKQTRCKNQIKAILHFYGIAIPEALAEGHWSRKFLGWLSSLEMVGTSGNVMLQTHLAELKYLRQSIAELTKQIRALAHSTEYAENHALLKSVKGVSTLTAMILLTELVDINRFKCLDTLANYVGLVPDTNSSGEKEVNIGITSRRNPHLRGILIEAAWVAVRKDPALTMAFQKMLGRVTKKIAIVKIARKLLNRIRYVLRTKTEYVVAVVQ
jgi:transposase